jgi:hypothetical protein
MGRTHAKTGARKGPGGANSHAGFAIDLMPWISWGAVALP